MCFYYTQATAVEPHKWYTDCVRTQNMSVHRAVMHMSHCGAAVEVQLGWAQELAARCVSHTEETDDHDTDACDDAVELRSVSITELMLSLPAEFLRPPCVFRCSYNHYTSAFTETVRDWLRPVNGPVVAFARCLDGGRMRARITEVVVATHNHPMDRNAVMHSVFTIFHLVRNHRTPPAPNGSTLRPLVLPADGASMDGPFFCVAAADHRGGPVPYHWLAVQWELPPVGGA